MPTEISIRNQTIRSTKAKGLKSNKKSSARSAKATPAKKQSLLKKLKKKTEIAVRIAIVLVIAGVLIFGGRSDPASEEAVTRVGEYAPVATLDELSSAQVAAEIARNADLLVANNVQNMADSLTAQVEFSTAEGTYVAKPNIVATDAKTNKDIRKYTVQDGDTIESIARRFNITSNTIRWANDIEGSIVSAGRSLTILPVSGLLYKVGAGDSATSLANKYNANREQIVAFNDAEIEGLKTGSKIIIPDGREPAPVQTYIAAGTQAVNTTAYSFGSGPLYGGNGYSYGYCTWHVANRRAAIGRPIPRNLGNAVTWATLGGRAGMSVSGTPKAGAVLWHKNTYIAGGLGHVGFVEKVNGNGTITVSDMNYPYWGIATARIIPASEYGGYLYIY